MFATASHNPLKARTRARRLRLVFAAAFGAALLAGSVAVGAQTASQPVAKPTEVQKAASIDIERSLITYHTPAGARTVRVIPLFKTPADQQRR